MRISSINTTMPKRLNSARKQKNSAPSFNGEYIGTRKRRKDYYVTEGSTYETVGIYSPFCWEALEFKSGTKECLYDLNDKLSRSESPIDIGGIKFSRRMPMKGSTYRLSDFVERMSREESLKFMNIYIGGLQIMNEQESKKLDKPIEDMKIRLSNYGFVSAATDKLLIKLHMIYDDENVPTREKIDKLKERKNKFDSEAQRYKNAEIKVDKEIDTLKTARENGCLTDLSVDSDFENISTAVPKLVDRYKDLNNDDVANHIVATPYATYELSRIILSASGFSDAQVEELHSDREIGAKLKKVNEFLEQKDAKGKLVFEVGKYMDRGKA